MKIILTAIGSKYIHTALGLRSIRAYAKGALKRNLSKTAHRRRCYPYWRK